MAVTTTDRNNKWHDVDDDEDDDDDNDDDDKNFSSRRSSLSRRSTKTRGRYETLSARRRC